MNDCLNCGNPAHITDHCNRPRHSSLRPSDPSQLAKTVATSLKGAELGRRAGYRTAQSKAAELVLHELGTSEIAIKLYNKIMDLVDQ